MNARHFALSEVVTVDTTTPVFLAPFEALDDVALLAHFRGARAVNYYPVADAEETRADKIQAVMQGRFEFNGETHTLGDAIDWLTNPSTDVEWHILLHKFYYAVGLGQAFKQSGDARYARRWAALIEGWMRLTPLGFIAADVTGRRVQNWIYSYHFFVTHAAHTVIDAGFHRRLLHSIHDQVEYLCEHLTAKRNHRTLELYAIFLAGMVFPEMRCAAYWRDFALKEIVANIASDLLSDGVQCELSTDYHHLVLRNYLNVRRLAAMNDLAVPTAMDTALQRTLEFSMHVHRPDGIVPSFSDGDARSFLELLALGSALYGRADMRYVATRGAHGLAPRTRAAHFADSGYSVVRSDWTADAQHLVFDCGPLGEGNHGHFDCLSFELAAHGRSLIVDPGRYTYSEAPDAVDGTNWRVHFRSTASHNTVCVDGRNQTRYEARAIKEASRHAHGSVRHKICGPAPQATMLERCHGEHLDVLHGRAVSHEYDAVHERCIVFVDRRYWIVSDWLRAESEHEYALHFQLGAHAQGDSALRCDEGLRVHSPGLLIAQSARDGVEHSLVPSWVSMRYGDKQRAPKLRSVVHARDADFDTLLLPWREQEPALQLDDIAVKGTRSRALRITLNIDGEAVTDTWFHSRCSADQEWSIGEFSFSGRWVFVRQDSGGRVLRALSHAGARLVDAASNAAIPFASASGVST